MKLTRFVLTRFFIFALFAIPTSALEPSFAQSESCGDFRDSFRGVPVLSNKNDEGYLESCEGNGVYGWQYQCVEYVRRFYGEALGSNAARWARIGHARNYGTKRGPELGLDAFDNSGPVPPAVNDILVFDGVGTGHVAIITSVTDSTVSVIEQNVASGTRGTLTLSESNGRFTVRRPGAGWSKFSVTGWSRLPFSSTGAKVDYVTFAQGNPGIPGDGTSTEGSSIGASSSYDINEVLRFGSSQPSLTVTAYSDQDLSGLTVRIGFTDSDCNFGILPDLSYAPTIDGVIGSAAFLTRSQLDDALRNFANADPIFDCQNSRLENAYVFGVFAGGVAELDALSIGFGDNAFPSDSTPSP